MTQLIHDLFSAQPDMLCIIAGLILIVIGVVGSIKTYIDPGRYGRIAALGFGVVLLVVGFTLYAKSTPQAAEPQKPVANSSICTFDAGPQAGSTNQLPETELAAVGSPCQDSAGNKGVIVAPDTPLTKAPTAAGGATAGNPSQAAVPEPVSTSLSDRSGKPISRICTFKTGPNAGATHELPRAKLQTIGSTCHDLKGNSGFIVASDTPLTP